MKTFLITFAAVLLALLALRINRTFAAGSVPEVGVNKDGSLHIKTIHQGNVDFYGQSTDIQNVFEAMSNMTAKSK
jgi:hypothetical protein